MTKKTEGRPAHPPLRPATRAWWSAAAIRRPITASSIRRSITPRPCSIRPRRTFSRAAAATLYGRRGTPDVGGTGTGAARARRPAVRRRHAACRPASRRFRPRCCRCCKPAIMCWSPTASIAPTRNFCDDVLTRYGVTTTYYDPLIGARHRRADAAEHARGLCGGAGLALASRCRTYRRSPQPPTPAARWC